MHTKPTRLALVVVMVASILALTTPRLPAQAMSSLEAYLRDCGLDKPLLHMVKLRACRINGCAYRKEKVR